MEKIGIFDWLFGKKVGPQPTGTRFKLITDVGDGFYSYDGALYQSDIVRSCIRPKYKAVGKLFAKHIKKQGNNLSTDDDKRLKHLLRFPNPLMSMQDLQEKLTTQLELNGNAFALIVRDDNWEAEAIYPIPATMAEMMEGPYGDMYIRFSLPDGKEMTVPYVDVIHIRQDFHDHQLFGDSPQRALSELMEKVHTLDQGLTHAIKNSAVVRWIMKFNTILKPETQQEKVNLFAENYLNTLNAGGAIPADNKYELQEVNNKPYVPNEGLSKQVVERIYNFFGVNEKIIRSEYDENEWTAYYESNIEPLAMKFSHEFTRKLFSDFEISEKGNEIIFEATSLQYASMKTKLELNKMIDRGAMTPNEWRKVMNLPPVEGGDELIRRLDTAAVEGGEEDDDDSD